MAFLTTRDPGNWFAPERAWPGRKALVPVESCYRILDVLLWLVGSLGLFALVLTYLRGPALIAANPLFGLMTVLRFPSLAAALFRGWPFRVRYAILVIDLFVFCVASAMVVGLTPNWSFLLVTLVSITSLFSGTRAGLATVLLISAAHILVAWGWLSGRLPAFMPGVASISPFMDFTVTSVWIRMLVVAAGLLTGLVVIMRYVLRDLSNALREATSSLQKLATEQEHRARAEEARLKAETAVREAQKFEALGRLASGVAHDFNNALCVMKCWASFLSEGAGDPLVKEAVTEIRAASDNATHLTQHLLAFSRSDTGPREVVDLSEVVTREGRTLTRLLPKDVTVSVDAGPPVHVRLGRGQLQEIILNLAINARDAMPRGGQLAIRVATVRLEGDAQELPTGSYARLEVSDTGAGMDAATQARIFEPFFTTKTEGRGTGLGLSMVFGLVAGAAGRISVSSEVGRGTTLTIWLPEAAAGERQPEPRAIGIVSPVRCRVLVVEEQPEIRSLIDRILSREGFPTVVAATGAEAVGALAVPGAKFGLLLVAGVMPGMTVRAIVAEALRYNPACPVIVLAAGLTDPALLEAVQDGVYVLLPKPFDAGQLREAVNRALARPA